MTPSNDLGWKERWTVPDPQVLDAARQFDAGRKRLEEHAVPGAGLLLPLLQTSAVALELYLKALSAREVWKPWTSIEGVHRVHAEPRSKRHSLGTIFREIPDEVRRELLKVYDAHQFRLPNRPFEAALQQFEGLFVKSRYPFEYDADITIYPMGELSEIIDFLGSFVTALEPRTYIQWNEQSPRT